MQSQLDDFIHPQGWQPWAGKTFENTCYFAEFENRGPGSVTTKRVKWPGIKKVTKDEISAFTAAKFIHADQWIKSSGVPYDSGFTAGL